MNSNFNSPKSQVDDVVSVSFRAGIERDRDCVKEVNQVLNSIVDFITKGKGKFMSIIMLFTVNCYTFYRNAYLLSTN